MVQVLVSGPPSETELFWLRSWFFPVAAAGVASEDDMVVTMAREEDQGSTKVSLDCLVSFSVHLNQQLRLYCCTCRRSLSTEAISGAKMSD